MQKLIIYSILFILSQSLYAQGGEKQKYLIEFTDKVDSPFSTRNPEVYLSARALERRKKHRIRVDESDFPVNPNYLEGLRSFVSEIMHSSRWLNACTVLTEEYFIPKIERLPFVKSVKFIGKTAKTKLYLRKNGKTQDRAEAYETTDTEWGFAETQNESLNLRELHANGFRGEGMLVAVLDGGFSNTDIMPFFDKLRSEKRLLPGYDFVDKDDYVFETSAHGSQVLSVMAADMPNVMVGTAPDALFVCLKTEDNSGEYRAEEFNWVAAVEYADSLGVDIVNSSLGYTTFSDKEMNYTYACMNGKTSPASCAADIAFTKGMIIVNSVGNEGNTEWKYLDAPADAKTVLAVGATDRAGYKTQFSSVGPTADGRIKPDVSALGKEIVVASVYSRRVKKTKGTSFSSPLVAGAVAALWQAFPERTNADILQAVKLSAHRSQSPDNEIGYGIPDFERAIEILGGL